MTRIAPLLALLFTSSLLSCTSSSSSSAAASILCSWTKVWPNKAVHHTFLRSAPSPRLYHGFWSAERALLGCVWSEDPAVIQEYVSLCRERTLEFSHHPDGNVTSLFEAEEQCVPLVSPDDSERRRRRRSVRSIPGGGETERSEVRVNQRVKRGFIAPGTLWCGSGNKAPSYADLGVFSDTDSCCREHDQCKNTILSFRSQYGVFNSNIFTMSHCDCDKKFRHCLKEANDSISNVVGYTFFDLLKMHCFEFSHRLQCAQRNWFGLCKETKMTLYAVVHPPSPYVSSNTTEGDTNSTIINATAPAELPEGSTFEPRLVTIAAAASTVPTPFLAPVTNASSFTESGTPERPAEPERRQHLENWLQTNNQTVAERDTNITEIQTSCGVFKNLDECRDIILPQQKKYGLHNPESRTLYHCNCTARLFQTLAQQKQVTEVLALLLGHVSPSCFLPQDCTAGNICTAGFVKAQLPQMDRRTGSTDVEEQRHLQAVRLQVRRPNSRRGKRKDRAPRLHKLCLKLTRPRQTDKARIQSTPRPAVTGNGLS